MENLQTHTNPESTPASRSTERSGRNRRAKDERQRDIQDYQEREDLIARLERNLNGEANSDTDLTPQSSLIESTPPIIDKRKFSREDLGIHISMKGLTEIAPSNDDAIDTPGTLTEASPLESTETDSSDITDPETITTDPEVAETEVSPEKKKVWFKRLGYAASMHYKIIRGVGIKDYAKDLMERTEDALIDKKDEVKAAIYQKTEAKLWKLADEVASAVKTVSGEYTSIATTLSTEYKQFKEGFSADLENAMGMWMARRERARAEKAARAKYVNDKIVAFALRRERKHILSSANGASL
ncbi:MAG: hypothetical protein WAV04_02000 [Candidatus Microsaccharimonas sp.]|jgi:hypothetical protein